LESHLSRPATTRTSCRRRRVAVAERRGSTAPALDASERLTEEELLRSPLE
jgi:hypothetical protein